MKLACIHTVHAGTPDNPACRSCNCAVRAVREDFELCQGCRTAVVPVGILCNRCRAQLEEARP